MKKKHFKIRYGGSKLISDYGINFEHPCYFVKPEKATGFSTADSWKIILFNHLKINMLISWE